MDLFQYCFLNANIAAKITTLEKGLSLVVQQNCSQIHIVGGSELVVQMVQNIINGSPMLKIVKSWCLKGKLARIKHMMEIFDYITRGHVLQMSNNLAYWLANWGVTNKHSEFSKPQQDFLCLVHLYLAKLRDV